MKQTTRSPDVQHLPAFDHYVKIGVLARRAEDKSLPRKVRDEATRELRRYRDEGLIIQQKEDKMGKKKRGEEPATDPVYAGRGIIFAVIDDRERMPSGQATTVTVISDAIEAALDAGHETSDEIARYITTSAFQHVTDRRVRFNSVLKAGDVVGAQIMRKLLNAYNELEVLGDETEDNKEKELVRAEARGFAEAIQVVISPFSSESPKDPRLVDWDAVDRMTDNFIKEQRLVRRERKGNPQ